MLEFDQDGHKHCSVVFFFPLSFVSLLKEEKEKSIVLGGAFPKMPWDGRICFHLQGVGMHFSACL